jgi:signal transduction histidine kinase
MEVDEASRREMLEIIHRQTQWLIDIVNELLDLSRIDARRGKEARIEPCDLAALVRDTLDDLAAGAERWPLALDMPAGARLALADVAMLRQALVNVLGNARKFSPPDAEIAVALLEDGDQLGVAVTDHGIGMDPEELAHLGERFWRADRSGQIPGTGLGIAIVMETLKLLNGRMEVRSKTGQGTTVTLWVPAHHPVI